jgi:hypothetical protein
MQRGSWTRRDFEVAASTKFLLDCGGEMGSIDNEDGVEIVGLTDLNRSRKCER